MIAFANGSTLTVTDPGAPPDRIFGMEIGMWWGIRWVKRVHFRRGSRRDKARRNRRRLAMSMWRKSARRKRGVKR